MLQKDNRIKKMIYKFHNLTVLPNIFYIYLLFDKREMTVLIRNPCFVDELQWLLFLFSVAEKQFLGIA